MTQGTGAFSRRELLLAGASALANAAPTGPVIDCHVHAGIADTLEAPWSTIADPAGIQERMREARIDQAVIFPISRADGQYEGANRYIADLCRRYPGQFIGFAKHHPSAEKGRIRALLTRECRDMGLRGLKLLHSHPSREMLEVVSELGIPVLYHPDRVAQFEEVVAAYPSVNFILGHMGRDEEPAAISIARTYPNAYLDTAHVVTTRWIEQAVQEAPVEKIVFGSDEPEVDCRLEIFKIRVLKLPKVKEDLILGGNLRRLLEKVS
jgi:predicted TIM-barrel fold metal-dependent hydrolase